MSSFLSKPKSIKKSEIINKFYSLHPAEHKQINIKNKEQSTIKSFLIDEGVGEQIDVDDYLNFESNYTLVTISNMNKCIIDVSRGEKISPDIYNSSSKKLKEGDVIISRNASLGKITLVNKSFKGILNGGISYLRFNNKHKYYVFAFFLLEYGADYLKVLTSGGGTQKNAKRQNLLDTKIPLPTHKNNENPDFIREYVSVITQNIIDKEEQVEKRQCLIDDLIYSELLGNQKSKFKYNLPKKSDLLNHKRIDTGLYTEKYRKENHLIENYIKGYFQIPVDKFKSGSTPRIRIFNGSKFKYQWVTPTNITDEGFFVPVDTISTPKTNNLNKDCILFINRTSKGKKGEYVGITCFYDFGYYGLGQHNQGLYRIDHLKKDELLFISAFMNSKIMRKLCGNVSIGSKMKEMKSYDFATLKYPNFEKELKKKIKNLYYFEKPKTEYELYDYLAKERNRNNKIGIFQLNTEIIELKNKLKEIIDRIINEQPIKIEL
jgi:hypothetical protein